MRRFECLLTSRNRLLLMSDGPDNLAPIGGLVREGQSPLEAVTHAIQTLTGRRLTPSCAGLYFRLQPGHVSEYGLAFVADLPDGDGARIDAAHEWVALDALAAHDHLSAAYRGMIPRLLAADHPLAIVLAADAGGEENVVGVSTIDQAVISPLVFAVQGAD